MDLGLYSITFSNDIEKDIDSLEGLRQFLSELSVTGMRYFLEVFNPQIDIGIGEDKLPEYINDCIVRCLAGLTRQDSPLFLKIPYNHKTRPKWLIKIGLLLYDNIGGNNTFPKSSKINFNKEDALKRNIHIYKMIQSQLNSICTLMELYA